jgi:hypothetical protein
LRTGHALACSHDDSSAKDFNSEVRLVNALDRRQFEKLVIAHPSRHEDPNSQRPVPDQAGDAEPELVDEETRFTNKSTDRDAPGSLSRLAMRARTSRRVNGSTG